MVCHQPAILLVLVHLLITMQGKRGAMQHRTVCDWRSLCDVSNAFDIVRPVGQKNFFLPQKRPRLMQQSIGECDVICRKVGGVNNGGCGGL